MKQRETRISHNFRRIIIEKSQQRTKYIRQSALCGLTAHIRDRYMQSKKIKNGSRYSWNC